MTTRAEVINTLQEDHLLINLLLTEQCNFACLRCFSGSSPQSPKGYMSDEFFDRLEDIINDLQDQDIFVRLNLIGGEPTLNYKEFERCLKRVAAFDVPIDMTSNGWWLFDERYTEKYFQLFVDTFPYLGLEGGFSLRISDSDEHRAFRKKSWYTAQILNSILENPEEHFEGDFEYRMCAECDHEWYEEDIHICENCGEKEYYDYKDNYFVVPQQEENWIYVQEQDVKNTVPANPNGVGTNDVSSSYCLGGTIITYDPTGKVSDFCCNGSKIEVGTINDDPLDLITLALQFHQEMKPSCFDCRSLAEEWIEEKEIKLCM